MIYSDRHRIGFIHIPKAGGTSIRSALQEMFPGALFEAPMDHPHMQAWMVRDRVLGRYAFSRIRWFAVTRHPVHTIWASYRRTLQVARLADRRGLSAAYCDYLDRVLKFRDFNEHARTCWMIVCLPTGTCSGGGWRERMLPGPRFAASW